MNARTLTYSLVVLFAFNFTACKNKYTAKKSAAGDSFVQPVPQQTPKDKPEDTQAPTPKDDPANHDPLKEKMEQSFEIKSTVPVILDMETVFPMDQADFTISSHKLTGDTLSILLNYSGGCEEHQFSVYFNEIFDVGVPPIAALEIKHEDHGDACREYKSEWLHIDLKHLKDCAFEDVKIIFRQYNKEIIYRF